MPSRAAPRTRRSPTTRSSPTARSTALVAPSGNVEWLCLPRLGLAERLRRDPRSRRRRLPLRPGRRRGPGGAPLPARHDGRSRRAGARRPAGSSSATSCSWARGTTTTSATRPTQRAPTDYDAEPHPAAHGPLRERRGAADPRLRAGVRLRPAPRSLGVHRRAATTRASAARREDVDVELDAHDAT